MQSLFSFSSLYPVLEVSNRPATGCEEARKIEQCPHETYGSQVNLTGSGDLHSLYQGLIDPLKAICGRHSFDYFTLFIKTTLLIFFIA